MTLLHRSKTTVISYRIMLSVIIVVVVLQFVSFPDATCAVTHEEESNTVSTRTFRKQQQQQHSSIRKLQPVQQQPSVIITKLVLINAITDTPITDLVNNQTVDVGPIVGSNTTTMPEMNINAIGAGSLQQVRFGFNRNTTFRIDRLAPFSFCGNVGYDFNRCTELGYGTYTVLATPVNADVNNTVAGPTVRVRFTIINSYLSAPIKAPIKTPIKPPTTRSPVKNVAPTAPKPPIIGLRLMYTGVVPNKYVRNLVFDRLTVIDLRTIKDIPTDRFNIEAVVNHDLVQSVFFSPIQRLETSKPLAYCGNDAYNFFACEDFELNKLTNITITAYSGPHGTGDVVETRFALLQVIRSKPPTVFQPSPTAPVTAPTKAIVPPVPGCPIPKLVGNWERPNAPYPITVAEAQGTMIGNDFIITSGFKNGYAMATNETYAFDMFQSSNTATWRRMDDMPFPDGLTHLGVAVKGMVGYFCGGYVGGALGTHDGSCFSYDHSVMPGNNQQWKQFHSLPDGGRSGGGMIYDSTIDALVYSAGSHRPIRGRNGAYDYVNTWSYTLKIASSASNHPGWVSKTNIPFTGNHMNFVTAHDNRKRARHYFWGGQHGDDEYTGNTDELYEYNAITDKWMKRASVPFPIGHAAASARAIGCGFLFAGGRTNTGLTSAIMYYDIPTDQWIHIGNLTHSIHTNVCAIGNETLRCETGWASGVFSWQHRIIV